MSECNKINPETSGNSQEHELTEVLSEIKTKQRLHERNTEHFKALIKNDHSSAIADLMSMPPDMTLKMG